MKKLEKLTLKELCDSTLLLNPDEANATKGGYTFEQYESMLANGTWTEGYVDGMGYIGYTSPDMFGYGGSATATSFSDWSSGNVSGLAEIVAKAILGEVPLVGSAVGVGSDLVNDTKWEINTALLNAGYTGSNAIYLVSTSGGYYVYSESGTLIYSK
ncbi:hypothetical protein [Gaoshiqia sp. Z1-71]|uniref:hypothetical protein n=1 Tax=Gaoshiqia hydrogeniformans TaxID=3290090 RepID=UPI003BF8681B